MTSPKVIALLTDFGADDWFVGSMKAVILARCSRRREEADGPSTAESPPPHVGGYNCPPCTIVDLCHSIEPGAIGQAAWILEHTYADFPTGTIFCVVVDPGVGTARRALVARAGEFFFTAPDNGVLTAIRRRCDDWECRAITNPKWMRMPVSNTFHGRDLFAPTAAQIAVEGGIVSAGAIVNDTLEIEVPGSAILADGAIEGRIIWFDRFGNAITTIDRELGERALVGKSFRIDLNELALDKISSTYSDVAPNEPAAYWGSLGTLEIGVRNGSARENFHLQLGERVCLRPANL